MMPTVYAKLLGDNIAKHKVAVWLVNTGWTGGPYGTGSRMKISYTRAMIRAALDGSLMSMKSWTDPVFGLAVPEAVPGVPTEILHPRNTWSDPAAYDTKAAELVAKFKKGFEQFAAGAPPSIAAAGPR
jgi:phosphoenolpyruvate carboxykinase (ATP)